MTHMTHGHDISSYAWDYRRERGMVVSDNPLGPESKKNRRLKLSLQL